MTPPERVPERRDAEGGVTFTVMTYNVGNGLARPRQLAALLRTSRADLIALQELEASQAEALASDLGDRFPHQALFPTGFSGKGLLSRFPLSDLQQLHIYPERPDLRAVVEVAGKAVTIVVGHPPPQRLRRGRFAHDPYATEQIQVLARVAVEWAPAVLLGDFNMTERHPGYAGLIALGLIDAYRAAGTGRGYTVPTRLGQSERRAHRLGWLALVPFLRFDYVFHTAHFQTTAAWVGGHGGSDHLPVLARLRLLE
jgi:vancomycin resistance protein VanJ